MPPSSTPKCRLPSRPTTVTRRRVARWVTYPFQLALMDAGHAVLEPQAHQGAVLDIRFDHRAVIHRSGPETTVAQRGHGSGRAEQRDHGTDLIDAEIKEHAAAGEFPSGRTSRRAWDRDGRDGIRHWLPRRSRRPRSGGRRPCARGYPRGAGEGT